MFCHFCWEGFGWKGFAGPHFIDDIKFNVKKTSKLTPRKDRNEQGTCEIYVLFPFEKEMDKHIISI